MRVQSPLNKKLPGPLVSPRYSRGIPSGAGTDCNPEVSAVGFTGAAGEDAGSGQAPWNPGGREGFENCSLEAGAFGPAGTRYCLWCQPGSSAVASGSQFEMAKEKTGFFRGSTRRGSQIQDKTGTHHSTATGGQLSGTRLTAGSKGTTGGLSPAVGAEDGPTPGGLRDPAGRLDGFSCWSHRLPPCRLKNHLKHNFERLQYILWKHPAAR